MLPGLRKIGLNSMLRVIAISVFVHGDLKSHFLKDTEDVIYTRAGATITISWAFELSYQDNLSFNRLEIGVWRRWEPRPKLITVLKNGRVHPNPHMSSEAPAYYGRITWNGDLKKRRAAFEMTNVTRVHQNIYGCFLRYLRLSSALKLVVSVPSERAPDIFIMKPTEPQGIVKSNGKLTWSFLLTTESLQKSFRSLTLCVMDKERQSLNSLMSVSKKNVETQHTLLKNKSSPYHSHVHWSGDLTKNQVSFTLSEVTALLGEAEYDCIANFDPSEKSLPHTALYSTIRLTVYEVPVIINQTTSTISLIEGEAFQISCVSVGKPTPVVSVIRNGRPLAQSSNGSAVFHNNYSFRNDEGQYECQASNVAGQAVQLVQVDVQFVPFVPTIKNITPGLTSIKITWSSSDIDEGRKLVGYRILIHRCGKEDDEKIIKRNGTSNSEVLNGLEQNSTYVVWVSVRSTWSYSNNSEPRQATTLHVPRRPTITTLTGDGTSVSVTWSRVDTSKGIELVGYRIRVRILGNEDDERLVERRSTSNNAIVNELQQNTTYIVWVSIRNILSYSKESEPRNVTTLAATIYTRHLYLLVGVGAVCGVTVLLVLLFCVYKKVNKVQRKPLVDIISFVDLEVDERTMDVPTLDEWTNRELVDCETDIEDRSSILPPPVPPRTAQQDRLITTSHSDRHLSTPLLDNKDNVPAGERSRPTADLSGWEIPREDLTIDAIVGEGAFGRVARGKLKNREGNVAVKMLKEDADESNKHDLLLEFCHLRDLDHPHVIKLIGCVMEDPDNPLVITEYVPYGDLLGYLRKSQGFDDLYYKSTKKLAPVTADKLLRFAWQISNGMEYLSSKKIIHRDLAARNVLVGEKEMCKVTDFGLSRDIQGKDLYEMKAGGCIPVKWTALEGLTHGMYTSQSDVWSYGIVLYETFTLGGVPYPGMCGNHILVKLQEGYRMPRPRHVNRKLYEVMKDCWQADPGNRPTFTQLGERMKDLQMHNKNYLNLSKYDKSKYMNIAADSWW